MDISDCNFDEYINRKNTSCLKYDALEEYFGIEDVKPLWLGDMDFKTPKFILDDLKKTLDKGIMGYPKITNKTYDSIISWYKKRYEVDNFTKDDISLANGVTSSISACVEAFCKEDEEVIIQTPVYYPYFSIIKNNNRKIIKNPLINNNDYYTMDFEDFKKKITNKTKILLLCSPHNPVGRVWKKEELEELAKICLEKKVLIISDEIHCDLSFKPFTSMLSLEEKYHKNLVILNSPSKTFNVAGLKSAYIICKDKKIKRVLDKVLDKRETSYLNIFGIDSIASAYNNGEQWVDKLVTYLQSNINTLSKFLKANNSNITFNSPEATYLIWLNFSKIEDNHKNIFFRLLNNSKLALNDGLTFDGEECNHYFRLNIALPKSELNKSLLQLNNEFK